MTIITIILYYILYFMNIVFFESENIHTCGCALHVPEPTRWYGQG